MPNWLVIVQAVIQLLQQTGLLQVLIDIINKIIAQIGGGTTPVAAILAQAPALMKLYAKLPVDKQAQIDQLIVKLTL